MPVEKQNIAPGTELPALLSLLASHPPRVRLPSATVIRFPLTGSMGDKRGSEISYRSASAELTMRAPIGRERELPPLSLLTFRIHSSHILIGVFSTFITVLC